ncbi:MAG: hypothetical protein O2856_06410, partial [Planctomycetota bacterium]|nr:hypothetical protein [Planctomycetota bacterium]
LLQRTICLYLWLKTGAMMAVTVFYAGFVCIIPAVVGIFGYEMLRGPEYSGFREVARPVAAMSPFVVLISLYREAPRAWHEVSFLPFYIYHFVIATICVLIMWHRSRKLQLEYSMPPAKEVQS